MKNEQYKYCPRCGEQMPYTSKFCPICGAKMPENDPAAPDAASSSQTGYDQNIAGGGAAEKKPDKSFGMSKKIRNILIGVVVAVAVIIILIVALGGNQRIRLSNYITVTYSGAEGYGKADVSFDYEKFHSDYDGKLSPSYTGEDYLEHIWGEADDVEKLVDDCLRFSVDCGTSGNGYLSNGDEVKLTWDCDDATADSVYHVKLIYSDMSFKVKGLEEAESVDVFEGLTLTCSGTSPAAEADITYTPSDSRLYDLSISDFELSKSTGIVKDDVITVTLRDDAREYLISTYGIAPEEISRDYTAEVAEEYITRVADIPDDLLKDLKTASDKVISEEFSSVTIGKISECKYVGMMLFYNEAYETQAFDSFSTRLYLVYKITVHEKEDDGDYENYQSFYTYIKFKDPIMSANGSASIDLSDGEYCSDAYRVISDYPSWWGNYYYYGFDSLADMEDTLVYDEYSYNAYDSNIDEFVDDGSGTAASVTEDNDEADEVDEADAEDTGDSDYLCSFSSDRLITDADMDAIRSSDYGSLPADKSLEQMIINEIYARHGYTFSTDEIQKYFEAKDWYQQIGTYESDMDRISAQMSEIEKKNIDYLKSLE